MLPSLQFYKWHGAVKMRLRMLLSVFIYFDLTRGLYSLTPNVLSFLNGLISD